ncbi:HhH-GPD family protein [Methanogenium organophilum]|uniref:Adenine DNA glycosylase n=1 Tax=Methanogenium organophilum TaxID=2199 RepID=A0A9X9T8Q7_METOG|nr:A/G-specific adenine glycosylase [Methanogenium organophilum]WAI01407.1 A/G-specific adenine glycosylase [Methanogenium organophilum]
MADPETKLTSPFFAHNKTPFTAESDGNLLSSEAVTEFRDIIRQYYHANRREMAWRETRDPYAIFVAEVMLQQTQVARVHTKYPEFLAAFPDFATLAEAPLEEVLRVWQGMGYNRRAKMLRDAARIVMETFGGRLPETPEELVTLPGIGPATAASIVAFAYNTPVVFIETNIRRVFIHFFFPHEEKVHDDRIRPLVRQTLYRENPREWYYALMDYGAMLKNIVVNPNRRSHGYTVQPSFAGSDREIRGRVLRYLLEEGPTRRDIVAAACGDDIDRTEKIIRKMMDESLLTDESGRLRIA